VIESEPVIGISSAAFRHEDLQTGDGVMIIAIQKSPLVWAKHVICFSRVNLTAFIALLSLWIPVSVLGQDFSGFLEDYSMLEAQGENAFAYQTVEGVDAVAGYEAIMIDQPEIVIAADSKYKAMKPDDMKLISDTLRTVLVQQLERSNFRIVTTPGPNTLYLRTAITDLHLKRKRIRLIQLTPIGLAATVATMPFRDVMNKINLQEVTFEAELLDSQNENLLGARVELKGSATDKKQATSWKEFIEGLENTAGRLACLMDNAGLAVDARDDCQIEYPM
jgi:hypothetical protein